MSATVGAALAAANSKAAKAVAVADAAVKAAAEAQRVASETRKRLHLAAYQAWADTYDDGQLRAQVDTALAQLRSAPSILTLVDYLAAVLRRSEARSMAAEAEHHGAVLANPLPQVAHENATGDPSGFVIKALGDALVAVAVAQVQAEHDAVRTAAQAAYDSVTVEPPTAYRITRTDGRDVDDMVGSHQAISFRGGVATVRVEDLGHEQVQSMVRYWRSLPDTYSVHEVW